MVIGVIADIVSVIDEPLHDFPVISVIVAEKLIVQEERCSDIVIRVLGLYLFEHIYCTSGFKLRRAVIVPAFQHYIIDAVIKSQDQRGVSECDIDLAVNIIVKPHHAVTLLVIAAEILFERFGCPVITVLIHIAAGIFRLTVFHIVDSVVHEDRNGIKLVYAGFS